MAVVAFLSLALIGMLIAGFGNHLLAGDRRVLVVTMAGDTQQEQREALKRACGSLPGVRVVPDKGDPSVQRNFPVRFDIAGTSLRQEAALQACLNQHSELGVTGFQTENDGN